jgi:hypothetical protein
MFFKVKTYSLITKQKADHISLFDKTIRQPRRNQYTIINIRRYTVGMCNTGKDMVDNMDKDKDMAQ